MKTVETNRVLFLISVICFCPYRLRRPGFFYHQYQTIWTDNRLVHQQRHLADLVDVQSKALVDAEDKMSREVIRIRQSSG